jgi:uncharacterized membrane protein
VLPKDDESTINTGKSEPMRILLITTCLANIAFAFGTLPWMPERVAIHFDSNGVPNGFMSPTTTALLLSFIVGFVGVTILGCSLLGAMIAKHMPEHFNIPNREYWLNEENRPKTVRRMCSYVESVGVVTMLVILQVQWEIFKANQMVPPKLEGNNLHIVTGVLLGVIAVYTVYLHWSYRLPKEKV